MPDVEVDPAPVGVRGLAGDQHDLGADDAGVADHEAARLDHDLHAVIGAEVPVEGQVDLGAVLADLRRREVVVARQAAAEVHRREPVPAAAQRLGQPGDRRQRRVPGQRVALLRADVERDAELEALLGGLHQQRLGLVVGAAELAAAAASRRRRTRWTAARAPGCRAPAARPWPARSRSRRRRCARRARRRRRGRAPSSPCCRRTAGSGGCPAPGTGRPRRRSRRRSSTPARRAARRRRRPGWP